MAYQVINTACTTAQQLMSEISSFVTSQAGFSNAGEFLALSQVNVNRSFLAPDGWYHNIEVNPTACTLMSNYTKNKPTGTIGNFTLSYRPKVDLREAYAPDVALENSVTITTSISYPLVSRHFFTNGKLVAIVIETRKGEFRHHVFGTLDTYGDVGGGQWASGSSPQIKTSVDNYYGLYSQNISNKNYLSTDVTGPYIGYNHQVSPFSSRLSNLSIYELSRNSTSRLGVDYSQSIIRAGDGTLTLFNSFRSDYYVLHEGNYLGVVLPPYFNHYGANLYNGRTQIYPFLVFRNTRKTSSYYFNQYDFDNVNLQPRYYSDMLGYCDVTHLEPGTIVNNEWVVFPLSTKSTTMTETLRTNGFGVAYRK